MGFFFSFTLFLAVYWFFRSPIPAAIAGSIRRDGVVAADTNMSDAIGLLSDEVRGLREEVTELAERIDVSERVLADLRQRIALPGPSVREWGMRGGI